MLIRPRPGSLPVAVAASSAWVCLLTAVLLKLVLEVVLIVKKRVVARIRATAHAWVRVLNIATLLLVLPGSRFVLLGLTDVVFGGAVRLGGFFQVTALIVVLMLARGGVRRVLDAPPRSD